MSNMSYCRFQNTLADLVDCLETLNSGEQEIGSADEKRAAKKMIKEMVEFVHGSFLIDDEGEIDEKEIENLIEHACEDRFKKDSQVTP